MATHRWMSARTQIRAHPDALRPGLSDDRAMWRASITALAAGAVALAGCGGESTTKVGPAAETKAARTNGPIAFERYAHAAQDDHSAQIFVRATDGAVRQLTREPGGAFAPAWSPDGKRIAYERAFGSRHLIYTMNPDGRDARPLATGCTAAKRCIFDIAPAYSPDGRRVSFERVYGPLRRRSAPEESFEYSPHTDLMVVDASGGEPRAIASWGADPQPWDGAPRWSPDGSRLVLPIGTFKHHNKHTMLGTALVVLGADGRGQRRITSWDLGAGNPDWSPDGRRIVFNSEGGHSRSTFVVRPDGDGLTRLVKGGARLTHTGQTIAPAWSPDGRQIVFTTEDRECSSLHTHGCDDVVQSFDIYVMNADGTGAHHITSAPQFEARPAWGVGAR
jgi:TolB protein